MTEAVMEFVAWKDRLDDWLDEMVVAGGRESRRQVRRRGLGWPDGNYGIVGGRRINRVALIPAAFVDRTLPFTRMVYADDPEVMEVDSRMVLSGTSGLYPPEDLGAILDRLDRGTRNARSHSLGNPANVFKIGELPLYVSQEGKNRVRAYKQMARPLVAFVHPTAYPPASELTLRWAPLLRTWNVGRRAEPGSMIAVVPSVRDLLLSYGVEVGKRLWPGIREQRAAVTSVSGVGYMID